MPFTTADQIRTEHIPGVGLRRREEEEKEGERKGKERMK